MAELPPGEQVWVPEWNTPAVIDRVLGEGGQGFVYLCKVKGKPYALKWYKPDYLPLAPGLRGRLAEAVKRGPPNDRFLWPLSLAERAGDPQFGYLMPLREPRFVDLRDHLTGKVKPTLRALTTAGYELAKEFRGLHAKGLCYRDINWGNAFFDPATGEVRICDNDNVDVEGRKGEIGGMMYFMAPEIVRGEAEPRIRTDLHSLAVLLFYLFFRGNPFEGKQDLLVECTTPETDKRKFGTHPLFIYHPDNPANRPDPEEHTNPYWWWSVFPNWFQTPFVKTFTAGLKDPENGRVMEGQWMGLLRRLLDSLLPCPKPDCPFQNVYDGDKLREKGFEPPRCRKCGTPVPLPPRVKTDTGAVVMLYPGTKLYPHHLQKNRQFDLDRPEAEVVRLPAPGGGVGLRNLTDRTWTCRYTAGDGRMAPIPPGRGCRIDHGLEVDFGTGKGLFARPPAGRPA